ncbi:E3 ubiquitin-protein ligase PUB22-like [Salvia divinorum]|uniref:U-box domain-containing protein n=1 Tax=Salvia divinorum TaxID=28513 RepID=A0ABD1HP89_SALDI
MEEEIPSYFLCPISIDVMRDPVTVSTGITYDRHTIEKWLSSSKTPTCPVTKQPLNPAAALTPNHTLRRLIHAWSALHPTPKPSPETDLKSFFTDNTSILKTLIQLLHTGDSGTRDNAITLLGKAYAVADPIHLIGAGKEVFVETVRMIEEGVSRKAAVGLVVELCPWGKNRLKAVEAGAVAALVEMLLESGERREFELGMAALEQVCRCAEGRAELLQHGAGLAVVSKKILRVSGAATDRGVRIMGLIARYSANSRVLEEMVEVGVVAKLCLVLQVVASHKTKEKARGILRLHSRVWKESSCIPPDLLSFYPS